MTLIYKSIVRVVTRAKSLPEQGARKEKESSSFPPPYTASSLTRAFACHSKWRLCQSVTFLRACLHGGGGPQVGKVTRLGGVKK